MILVVQCPIIPGRPHPSANQAQITGGGVATFAFAAELRWNHSEIRRLMNRTRLAVCGSRAGAGILMPAPDPVGATPSVSTADVLPP